LAVGRFCPATNSTQTHQGASTKGVSQIGKKEVKSAFDVLRGNYISSYTKKTLTRWTNRLVAVVLA
jgi:hypothetical protein